eukprot:COSAG05_NODE_20970_length_275_cov_0.880682_1_plen_72_part_00
MVSKLQNAPPPGDDGVRLETQLTDALYRAWSKLGHVLFKRGAYREAEDYFRQSLTARACRCHCLPILRVRF